MMTNSFTRPLYTSDVNRLEQGRPIRVIVKPFLYHVGHPKSKDVVKIPSGYCSDGASVPRLLRWFIEPWGKYAQAAIVHDFIYSTQCRSRLDADIIFREAIKVITSETDESKFDPTGTSDYTRWGRFVACMAYWGVRVGGGKGYASGKSNYVNRSNRARDKVKERDPYLYNIIINSTEELLRAVNILSIEIIES